MLQSKSTEKIIFRKKTDFLGGAVYLKQWKMF